jgi:plastocyanin
VRSHLLSVVAAAAGALVLGCGGDDGEEEGKNARPDKRPAATGPTSTVKVEAEPGHRDQFVQKRLKTKAGKVLIKFKIPKRGEGHNVQIEQSAQCCTRTGARYLGGTGTILKGESTTATVNLKAGKYWFYCSVGGHWQGGMQGPLLVE